MKNLKNRVIATVVMTMTAVAMLLTGCAASTSVNIYSLSTGDSLTVKVKSENKVLDVKSGAGNVFYISCDDKQILEATEVESDAMSNIVKTAAQLKATGTDISSEKTAHGDSFMYVSGGDDSLAYIWFNNASIGLQLENNSSEEDFKEVLASMDLSISKPKSAAIDKSSEFSAINSVTSGSSATATDSSDSSEASSTEASTDDGYIYDNSMRESPATLESPASTEESYSEAPSTESSLDSSTDDTLFEKILTGSDGTLTTYTVGAGCDLLPGTYKVTVLSGETPGGVTVIDAADATMYDYLIGDTYADDPKYFDGGYMSVCTGDTITIDDDIQLDFQP